MPDRIIDFYRRHAGDWDRERGRQLFELPWLNRFLAPLPPAPAILDLGCGSGEPLAAHLAARSCRLTGVDTAAEMVALCRHRFPDHTWIVADMRQPPLNHGFDGVLAWDSFFHLAQADQRRMFPLFAHLTRPGGTLLFTSGPAHGTATGTMWGEQVHHASLDAWEYRALLAENGFAVLAHRVEDPQCGHHTVWLAQRGA